MFDLDDTIVQAGSYVSGRVVRALGAAHDQGYVLSVASGRPLCIVDKKVLGSGSMDYCVGANGAQVVRLRDGAELVRETLLVADALDCMALIADYHPAWNAFIDDCAYFEWKGASYMLFGRTGAVARGSAGKRRSPVGRLAWLARCGVRWGWRMLTQRQNRQVRSIEPYVRRAPDGVYKMGCTIPDAARCRDAAQVLQDDGRYEVVRMGTTELEITRRGVTKASSAKRLMDALGFDASQTVAFGDGSNDLPLCEVVGRFVAVANADEAVRAAATDLCPSVGDDGVACWIEGNLLSGACLGETDSLAGKEDCDV